MRPVVEDQRVLAARAAVEHARQRPALIDRQRIGAAARAAQVLHARERQVDAAARDLAGVGAGQRPVGRARIVEDDRVLPASAAERNLRRRRGSERGLVDGERRIAGPPGDRYRRDLAQIAERQDGVAVALIDDLDPLDGNALVVDLLGGVDQFNDEAVVDRERTRLMRQIKRQHVRVEQQSRLERIEHDALRRRPPARRRRAHSGKPSVRA